MGRFLKYRFWVILTDGFRDFSVVGVGEKGANVFKCLILLANFSAQPGRVRPSAGFSKKVPLN
jgi:hypothetical protein